MDRRRFLAAAASGASLGLAGCSGVLGSGSTPEFDVGMRAMAFVPATIEISAGETLVWYNNNDRPHTVTAYDDEIPDEADFFATGDFDSTAAAVEGYENGLRGTVDPGESYEHTFEVPGTYRCFCVPHESGGMIGVVTVNADE
jgi:plastocyanin